MNKTSLPAELSLANMNTVRAPAVVTWLLEWSGNLGGVKRSRSSVAWDVLGKPVFRLTASRQGKLTPLGDPAPNAPKWFAAVEMIRLAADQDWLHKATKEISKYWRHKRERRTINFHAKQVTPNSLLVSH